MAPLGRHLSQLHQQRLSEEQMSLMFRSFAYSHNIDVRGEFVLLYSPKQTFDVDTS